MTTHNIRFYGELTKILVELSSDTILICSTVYIYCTRLINNIKLSSSPTSNPTERVQKKIIMVIRMVLENLSGVQAS